MTNEFDQYAKTYEKDLKDSMPAGLEETEYFARYKIEYMVRELAGRSILRILDFGCGAGRSLEYLETAFPQAELHGFDPSEESVRIAAEQFPKAKVSAVWDDENTSRYDLILAANVFHHIQTSTIPQWLVRCRDALAPAGAMFLFEHNPLNPVTRYVFDRCVFDQNATMIRRGDLEQWANDAGLQIAAARYTLFFPRPLSLLRPIERWLGWLPLGAQYFLRLTRKQ